MPTPITAHTALLGVLGDPVRHSLSPAMHNAALERMGLDWVYLALPVAPADLGAAVRGLEAIDCRGLNVTLPHKQAVAELAAELTPLARRVGAVNTLVRRSGGGWLGTNTDVEGFLTPLQASGAPPQGGRAVVLGCGGSARAVVAALAELNLGRIQLAGRRPERLAAVVDACRGWAPQLEALPWQDGGADGEALAQALAAADLVVNTTPVGMASGSRAGGESAGPCPLTPAQLETLRPGSTVYDLIYTPRPTPLLRAAERRGCRPIDGLEMLVQQGAAALRLWTAGSGSAVPAAAMRDAALRQLAAH